MSNEQAKTKVIFRIWRDKTASCIALFPAEAAEVGNPYVCLSYEHIGQHGAASPGIVARTRPAKPQEYRDLAQELTKRGYRLQVVKRFTRADLAERARQLAR